jgi:hypothetical protein
MVRRVEVVDRRAGFSVRPSGTGSSTAGGRGFDLAKKKKREERGMVDAKEMSPLTQLCVVSIAPHPANGSGGRTRAPTAPCRMPVCAAGHGYGRAGRQAVGRPYIGRSSVDVPGF